MAGTIRNVMVRPLVKWGLNGVRPRWPEQYQELNKIAQRLSQVSMESGLDGRNNDRIRQQTPGIR